MERSAEAATEPLEGISLVSGPVADHLHRTGRRRKERKLMEIHPGQGGRLSWPIYGRRKNAEEVCGHKGFGEGTSCCVRPEKDLWNKFIHAGVDWLWLATVEQPLITLE